MEDNTIKGFKMHLASIWIHTDLHRQSVGYKKVIQVRRKKDSYYSFHREKKFGSLKILFYMFS